jgi:hypothetical protein
MKLGRFIKIFICVFIFYTIFALNDYLVSAQGVLPPREGATDSNTDLSIESNPFNNGSGYQSGSLLSTTNSNAGSGNFNSGSGYQAGSLLYSQGNNSQQNYSDALNLGSYDGTAMTEVNGKVVSAASQNSGDANIDPSGPFQAALFVFVSGIARAVLLLGKIFTTIGGFIFDTALNLTVLEIGNKASAINKIFFTSVDTLWKIFRDFGNLIIIFSLLFLAIKTIVNGDGFADKKILGGVLLAAIFINFSLFFTKLVFDISNIATYSIMQSTGSAQKNSANQGQGGSITANIANTFSFEKIDGQIYSSLNSENGATLVTRISALVTHSIFGMLLMIIIGCIFVAAALFLIIRFLIFLLLMITAPIGFIGKFIPAISGLTNKWWDELWKQSIAFPAFALMLYVALLFIESSRTLKGAGNINWYGLFTFDAQTYSTGVAQLFENLFIFVISVALLIAAIIIPGMIGGVGSKMIATGTAKVGAFTGRRMIDTGRGIRGGYRLANDKEARGKMRENIKNFKDKSKEDKLKFVGEKAKGMTQGAKGFMSRRAIDAKEALKDKTFDFRNISIAGRTIGERYGIGKGAKSYREIVEEKEKEAAKELDRSKKKYGLDEQTPEEKARAMVEQQTSKDEIDRLSGENKKIITQYSTSGGENGPNAHLYLQQISQNQKQIENLQKQINFAKNPGEYAAAAINNSTFNRLINILTMNFEKNRALSTVLSKQEQQWNKSADKRLVEDFAKMMKVNKDDEKKS